MAKKKRKRTGSPGIGKKIARSAGKAIIAGAGEVRDTVVDGRKGLNRYVAEKAGEKVHAMVGEAERDNAALEIAHKTEQLGESVLRNGLRKGKKAAGDTIQKISKLRHGPRSPKAPAKQKSSLKSVWNTSVAHFGAHVDFGPAKPGVISKAFHTGKEAGVGGLRMGMGKAVLQFHSKVDRYGGDNSAVEAAHHAEQFAERPAKYALNKGSNVAAWPVRFVSGKVRSAIRHKVLVHKKAFLARHKNIAQTRGVVQKAKALTRQLIKNTKPMLAVFGVCLLIYFFCSMVVGPVTAVLSQAAAEYLVTTTYPASHQDITDSTVQWKELEVELEQRIEDIETEFPDFDEYIYDVDPMEHNPFELISYLAAMYPEFTHTDVQMEIEALFHETNELQLIEETETRYDASGNPYEWKTLSVILKPKPSEEVIIPRLEAAGAKDLYDVFMGSGGNHQAFGNPFTFNWRDNISSHYGNRKNPTADGYEFHTGIDIAAAAGTPIRSIQDGVVVVSQWHDLYGYYIVIRNEDGITSLYAHCSALYGSVGDEVRSGQLIAAVGSTGNSTGNHLHLELKIGDLRVNPLFYIQASDE